MARSFEVLFSPAEFEALARRDLSRTTCVALDILRATSTIVTALANGAHSVIPVATIEEALTIRKKEPAVLLAGERDGFRITAKLTGSLDFDMGNSPREFTCDKVAGKIIVMTTTNGTRALRACAGAELTLVASFLNLDSVVKHVHKQPPENLLIVCSGTHEEASFEDSLGAGAICDRIWDLFRDGHVADSAPIARQIYLQGQADLSNAIQLGRNGRRLLGIPELRDDIAFCLRHNLFDLLAKLNETGAVVRC